MKSKDQNKNDVLMKSLPFLKNNEELNEEKILEKGKNPTKVPLSFIEEALLKSSENDRSKK